MAGHVKERLSLNLFVENFPSHWNNIALRECFEKHCKVMNGMVVGKRKLFVGLSKFSKATTLTKTKKFLPEKGFIKGYQGQPSCPKTFAEALKGRVGIVKEVVQAPVANGLLKSQIFSFDSPVTVEEWLNRSVVCTMEAPETVLLQDELAKIGIQGAMVCPLGGEDVMVTFSSTDEMETLVSSLKILCKKCVPWTSHYAPTTRRAWVQIFGLPLHLWSKVVLERLVAPFGNLVMLHRDT